MKKSKNRSPKKIQELFIIDEARQLVFDSEDKVFAFFEEPIQRIEDIYLRNKKKDDFNDSEQLEMEKYLDQTLSEPDEIWLLKEFFDKAPVHVFIKNFLVNNVVFDYVVIAFLSSKEKSPTFVLSHFPTKYKETVDLFRVEDLIFNQDMEVKYYVGLDGDALSEDDEFSFGLANSMLKLRGEKDIPIKEFKNFVDLREDTIESPDEIWRKTDHDGNVLVTFIKEFPDAVMDANFYIAVTLEEENSEVHTLLFSFPTNDESLVDRYRQGENLQAEDVTQESAH
ncbi:MAG: peptidase [Bdellovibrionaceae bacterium]|nr:peptidase [Pseudobdellovibrionaceae bacterium]